MGILKILLDKYAIFDETLPSAFDADFCLKLIFESIDLKKSSGA